MGSAVVANRLDYFRKHLWNQTISTAHRRRLLFPTSNPIAWLPRFQSRALTKVNQQIQAVETALWAAGINRETLMKDWGVTLWRIMVWPPGMYCKKGEIELYIDTSKRPDVDIDALKNVLHQAVSKTGLGEINIRKKTIAEWCCRNLCTGCFATPYRLDGKRQEWIG